MFVSWLPPVIIIHENKKEAQAMAMGFFSIKIILPRPVF
jgi:hypothetical protein